MRILNQSMQYWKAILATALVLTLTACAAPKPSDYAKELPKLDLKEYFNGTVDAWGIFKDRNGNVVKRFTVVMKCSWDGNTGVLDEDFIYSDGTTQKRVWTIVKDGDIYTGTAADVKGEASGIASGNALNWRYTLLLDVDDDTYEVQFDDWMYLMDQKTMLNTAEMSKFGIKLGEVILSFRKREE